MKKVLFAILAVFTILGTVVCLGFALFYRPSQETVYDMSEAGISELTERATFQIADLEILERYAIKVIQESDGSNGMPEDSAYYVYDASAAVGEYTPWAEYYVVRFADREKEYVASLTVSAGKNISPEKLPVSITACVNAFPASAGADEDKLGKLRQAALESCAQRTGAEKAAITLSYQAESADHLQAAIDKEAAEIKLAMGITGAILAAFSVWFILIYLKRVNGF